MSPMSRRCRITVPFAMLSAASFLIAGCAGPGATTAAADITTGSSATAPSSTTAPSAAGQSVPTSAPGVADTDPAGVFEAMVAEQERPSRTPGTLQYYLAPVYGEPQESVDRQEDAERAATECMAAAGQERVMETITGQATGPDELDVFYRGWGTRDWVVRNGYGITSQARTFEGGTTTQEMDELEQQALEQQALEQQAEQPAESTEYHRAWDGPVRTELGELWNEYSAFVDANLSGGFQPENDEDGTSASPSSPESTRQAEISARIDELEQQRAALDAATEILPGAGCGDHLLVAIQQGLPDEERPIGDPVSVPSSFEALLDASDRIRPAILADPEVVGPMEDWQECMAVGGHGGYADSEAPAADISQRLYTLLDWDVPDNGHWYVPVGWSRVGSDDTPDTSALLAEELSLAVLDYDCSVDLAPVLERVTLAHEQQFVIEHEAELIAYRASVVESW